MRRSFLSSDERFMLKMTALISSWLLIYLLASNQSLTPSDYAAWAQAVFSVVAILAAIWISKAERRNEKISSEEYERSAIVSVFVVIERGRAIISALSSASDGVASQEALHSISILAAKLESFDLIAKPNPMLMRKSLHAANYLRMYMKDCGAGMFRDRRETVLSLDIILNSIRTHYGITDEDFLPRRV